MQEDQTKTTINYMMSEVKAIYHEAAVRMGIADSVQNVLYAICANGEQCPQSDIYKQTGISRQTINSAIRKLERDGIVCLRQGRGRNTIVCLTEKGEAFAKEKIYPLFEIENKIWEGWSKEEQETYLLLTEKYRDGLKRYIKAIL